MTGFEHVSHRLEELFGLHLESCGDMNLTRPGTYDSLISWASIDTRGSIKATYPQFLYLSLVSKIVCLATFSDSLIITTSLFFLFKCERAFLHLLVKELGDFPMQQSKDMRGYGINRTV
jgi:hypothetical protein